MCLCLVHRCCHASPSAELEFGNLLINDYLTLLWRSSQLSREDFKAVPPHPAGNCKQNEGVEYTFKCFEVCVRNVWESIYYSDSQRNPNNKMSITTGLELYIMHFLIHSVLITFMGSREVITSTSWITCREVKHIIRVHKASQIHWHRPILLDSRSCALRLKTDRIQNPGLVGLNSFLLKFVNFKKHQYWHFSKDFLF